jgi:hypothetical protein
LLLLALPAPASNWMPPVLYRWRITRLRASPAALIGYVEAPDAEQAIREFTNPEHQKRLVAQRAE